MRKKLEIYVVMARKTKKLPNCQERKVGRDRYVNWDVRGADVSENRGRSIRDSSLGVQIHAARRKYTGLGDLDRGPETQPPGARIFPSTVHRWREADYKHLPA